MAGVAVPGVGEAARDEVLHYLGLRVDRHGPSAGEIPEVDVMPLALELEVDPAVLQALVVEAGGEASRPQEGDAAVLKHAGPLACLAVRPAAQFDEHRVDAAQREQMRKQQARRAGADDAYLSSRARHRSRGAG